MPNKSLSRSGLLTYQKYSSLLVGNDAYNPIPPGAYHLLESEILTGTQSSVTFSSLGDYSSDYQHLQIRAVVRGASAFNAQGIINADTGSNYNWHWLEANGSNVNAGGATSSGFMNLGVGVSETNVFSYFVIDILDPFQTTKFTTIRSAYGAATAGSKWMGMASAAWRNTNSLTSFEIKGSTLQIGSRFSIYGLRSVAT